MSVIEFPRQGTPGCQAQTAASKELERIERNLGIIERDIEILRRAQGKLIAKRAALRDEGRKNG